MEITGRRKQFLTSFFLVRTRTAAGRGHRQSVKRASRARRLFDRVGEKSRFVTKCLWSVRDQAPVHQ